MQRKQPNAKEDYLKLSDQVNNSNIPETHKMILNRILYFTHLFGDSREKIDTVAERLNIKVEEVRSIIQLYISRGIIKAEGVAYTDLKGINKKVMARTVNSQRLQSFISQETNNDESYAKGFEAGFAAAQAQLNDAKNKAYQRGYLDAVGSFII